MPSIKYWRLKSLGELLTKSITAPEADLERLWAPSGKPPPTTHLNRPPPLLPSLFPSSPIPSASLSLSIPDFPPLFHPLMLSFSLSFLSTTSAFLNFPFPQPTRPYTFYLLPFFLSSLPLRTSSLHCSIFPLSISVSSISLAHSPSLSCLPSSIFFHSLPLSSSSLYLTPASPLLIFFYSYTQSLSLSIIRFLFSLCQLLHLNQHSLGLSTQPAAYSIFPTASSPQPPHHSLLATASSPQPPRHLSLPFLPTTDTHR